MDLEMTGLDPRRHTVVEIATIITNDDLEIIAEGPELVVFQPPEALSEMDEVVLRMHTRSGLLAQIQASTLSLEAAGEQTLDFLKQHIPDPATVPLCGNSIGTDRRFLDVYLPDIENYLHYRSVDVSSIKELLRRWNPTILKNVPHKKTSHRALDDIRESIAELRFYRGAAFLAPEPKE
jgi:oligoribonuclease